MATANKTQPTDASVAQYLAAIEDEARRQDCEALVRLLQKVTGEPARMWGTAIVGFGSRHYRYESGREGDTCLVGFASRKGDISVYGTGSAPDRDALLVQLGKHKTGKGCLYIRKLSDIDAKILERLVAQSIAAEH
ncbi:DUF1801 domain-containing protein [Burkholderiaceae bacterium UC74_6]